MKEKKFTPSIEYIKEKYRPEADVTNPDFEIQKCKKNEVIFSEGSEGNAAYVLRKGRVEISVNADGKKIVLTTLKEKSVFGEIALVLEQHKRTATATAIENSELVRISKGVFDKYMKATPKLISTCLIAIASRLQDTTARVSRSPNTFVGVSQILNLLSIHKKQKLSYDKTIDALSNALFREKTEIRKMVSMMEGFNLLELKKNEKGEEITHLLMGDKFLEKAVKTHEILKSYQDTHGF